METLTEVRYTYACAACGYQTTVLRPDASHSRELALCARCDGQVWLSVAETAGPAARVGGLVESRESPW
jgi:predicted nucleic acid-binding Zn ribbon protein